MLTRDAILSADDTPLRPVEVPEWGGTVFVRSMTLAALQVMTDQIKARGGDENAAFIAVQVTLDENGKRLFQDADEDQLKTRSVKALNRIVAAFNEANGLTAEKVEAAEGNC